MRRLILLRHAKSDWSAAGQRDFDRPLAARGRAVAPLVGRYMAQHGLAPDRAIVSPARRTRETWELVAAAFARPPACGYEQRLYESTARAMLGVVHETAPDVRTLLLIGHNPGIQELAALLMATGDIEARQQLMEKFPTAALAALDFATDDWRDLRPSTGRLERFVTPRALQLDCE